MFKLIQKRCDAQGFIVSGAIIALILIGGLACMVHACRMVSG